MELQSPTWIRGLVVFKHTGKTVRFTCCIGSIYSLCY